MLKLNKGIHFNILTVFAIVFVCVYLYYTISDLKKIAVEVKKHSTDIANIVNNLAILNKDFGELKKKAAACPVAGACALKPQINIVAAQPVVQVAEAAPGAPPPEPEDDASSVDTNDVKNLLSDIPDGDDVDDEPHENVDAPAAKAVVNWTDMTIEELKKECKSAGLSTKGTKDVLVGRLSEHHAS